MYSEENNEKLSLTEGLTFQSWPQCKTGLIHMDCKKVLVIKFAEVSQKKEF